MKPFKITDFVKAMLYIRGRKLSLAEKREILIWHVILYTRSDFTFSEVNIYDEIKKILNLPEDKVERKFERAMNKK